jgi:iron-sulfur cluster assembly accessory protein
MQFTDSAVSRLRSVAPCIRIGVIGGGCSGYQHTMSVATEKPSPMDKVFPLDGVTVYIDQLSYMYLKGTTLDYQDTLAVSGFMFNNPNATHTCGCGKSFST